MDMPICYLGRQQTIITSLLYLQTRFGDPKFNVTASNKYDYPSGLDFDPTPFAASKYYAVAANFDTTYAAAAVLWNQMVPLPLIHLSASLLSNQIHHSIVKRENDFVQIFVGM